MYDNRHPLQLLWFLALLPASAVAADHWTLANMVGTDSRGQTTYHARPVDTKFRNPISAADERDFQSRARYVIAQQAQLRVPAGNTYFENEKRTYGYLMAQVLAGREQAIKDLQVADAQAGQWHRETQGIDFYACFTLKHQVRKYFYFGDLLDDDYRQRMFVGAKAWTSQDPLRRPHYAFQQPGGGWGPDQKNSWVDVRSTENLYLMRVTSVYLFAEATGNREVAEQYKREFTRYARTLYRVSMGEWESENYHGHSIGPLCNLYDFARDEQVRMLAKACLDWVFAVGAVKYYRGGFNGPTKRDYNHVQPFGGSAASMLWLHFGDCPVNNAHWESDEVHLITSAYRPPPAVLQLARKQFAKPVELMASKPQYSATTSGDAKSPPEYLETQYFGHSFQMGSLSSGTSEDGGDVNGFKILAYSEKRGAVSLQGVPGPDPRFVGSPAYQQGKVSGPNRVGQYGNLAIWLVRSGKSPWRWVIPQEVQISEAQGVTFLQCDRTWVAMRTAGYHRAAQGRPSDARNIGRRSRTVSRPSGAGGDRDGQPVLRMGGGSRGATVAWRLYPVPANSARSGSRHGRIGRRNRSLSSHRWQATGIPLERRPAGSGCLARRRAIRLETPRVVPVRARRRRPTQWTDRLALGFRHDLRGSRRRGISLHGQRGRARDFRERHPGRG